MLTLYFAPGASSMAPHIALHEVGAPFDGKPVSLANKAQREPDYLAINPAGKVPTLVDGGLVLTEVLAILYYLARRFPQAQLWVEDDLEGQAQALSWMSFTASSLHPARRQGFEVAREVFGIAEQKLGARDWAIGRYSIADIHLFRLYWRQRDTLEPVRASLPALEAHYARMMARPAVQKTLEVETAVGYQLPT